MCRRSGSIGLALLQAACFLAMSAGCHCPRCPGGCGDCPMQGYAVGGPTCDKHCDRYAARPYNHKVCCRAARRDPRIPGPRIVSTLPAHPEMAAPGYFQPVPTYAVFGPRSEQPDGIEPQMQPLMPDEPSGLEGEPLPMPTRQDAGEADGEPVEDDEPADGPSALKLSAPGQTVRQTGWKPAKKQADQADAPTRPCAKCSISFRQPTASPR